MIEENLIEEDLNEVMSSSEIKTGVKENLEQKEKGTKFTLFPFPA